MDSSGGIGSSFKTAQAFLTHRNFDQCQKYAKKAFQADPSNTLTARILATASALAAATRPGPPDWYSIIGLPTSTQCPTTIRARVDYMKDLLDPVKNPNPYAQEAYGWVLKAAEVLSDQKSKARYDSARENGGGATFWTVCPYCYYMFEYQREYVGRALLCSNSACKRVFTAEPVAASAVPPPEVADSGKYFCGGFVPLGGADTNHGWDWWAPFMFYSGSDFKANGHVKENASRAERCEEEAVVIEVSDSDQEQEKPPANVARRMKKKVAAVAAKKLTGKGVRVKVLVEEKEEQDSEEDDIYVSLKPVVTDL